MEARPKLATSAKTAETTYAFENKPNSSGPIYAEYTVIFNIDKKELISKNVI